MAVVKNFGLKGVADDVQFGKAGGRIVFEPTGGSGGAPAFTVVNSGGANISLQGGAGVLDNEYVTVAQLNSVAAGITVKQSARVATQGDLVVGGAEFGAGAGAGGTGQFTGAPTVVDGVTLAAGDRILVRLEGVTFFPTGNIDTIDETAAQRNGIYVVVSDGVWDRADDHDENGEVTYGNYIFVTEGAVNEGQAFVLANILNKPIVADAPTLNAEPIAFVLFSAAPTYEAAENGGLEVVSGDEFRLDIDNLTSGSTTLDSTFAFGDGTAGGPDSKETLGSIFNGQNVVYGIGDFTSTGAGFIVRTGEDSYKIADLVATSDAGLQGISLQEDLAGAGTIEIGLDIAGLSDVGATDTGEIAYFDGVNNSKRSLAGVASDIDLVRSNTFTAGIITKVAEDVYAGRQILTDSGANSGLTITNGDLVAGNATIGLDFDTLGTKTTPAVTDELIINEAVGDGANKRTTVKNLIDIIAGNFEDNQIGEDDSRVTVTDNNGVGGAGGKIDIVADAQLVATFDSAKANILALEVQDIGDTQVVVGGADGRLTSGAGFTYNGLTLAVSGDISASGDIGAVGGTFSGNIGAVGGTFSGNIGAVDGTFSGNIGAVGGTFSGNISGAQITGTSFVGGTFSGTTADFTDITGTSLDVGAGTIEGGNATLGDITATGLDVGAGDVSASTFTGGAFSGTNVTASTLAQGQIVFAGAGGLLVSDSALSFDGNNLTVGGNITAGGLTLTGDGNFSTTGDIVGGTVTASDLTEGSVVFAGVNGKLEDDVLFTYSAGTGALAVTNSVTSLLFTGGAFNGTTGTFTGAITGASLAATGDVSGDTGTFTGAITGASLAVTGTSSALSYAAGSGGITDASLSGGGAIVFTDGAKRLVDDGATFNYNATTQTLTVENLVVNGSGGLEVNENELAFGTADGNVVSSSNFSVDAGTATLSVGQLDVDGASQIITGNVVDGDISIVPNGEGEVIIGSAGAAVIASDGGQSMTVYGDSNLFLESGTGSVIIKDGGLEVAQFDSNAGADTWLTFQSDTAANGVKIGTSQNSDIKFVLGTGQLVKPENAADYNATLAAGGAGADDAFVTKSFVDDAIEAGQPVEMYKSIVALVDLSANGVTNIDAAGALTTLPAGATVLRVKVQIGTADNAATLRIGESGNAIRYMDHFENDPQDGNGIFVSEVFDTDATAIQLQATVADTAGDVNASAQVSIEYRVPVTVTP